MTKHFPVLFLCIAILIGCDHTPSDNVEENNPIIRKGLDNVDLKRWSEAIDLFKKALVKDPDLARPDLELALIYHQQKKNYVHAIYHYESYLEKRPKSEKKIVIEGWIRHARGSLAAEAGQRSGNNSEEIIRLTRENNLLRKQLEEALARPSEKQVAVKPPIAIQPDPKPVIKKPISKPKPTPVSSKPIQRIQTPAPIPETYKVLPGDTLSSIARTVYGNSSKWREIYGANMDKMKSENDLKAGQVITIPKLEN